MRKFLSIFILAALLPLGAQAQNAWWLFPGSRQRQQQEQKEQKRTEGETTRQQEEVQRREDMRQPQARQQERFQEQEPQRQRPDEEELERLRDELWRSVSSDFSGKVNITMILPLNTSSATPSANFLEMYSGALLALRDLGLEGMEIDFEILDSSAEGFRAEEHISGRNVIIGPVEYRALAELERHCSQNQVIISPLEPRAAELVDGGRIIQSPVPWTAQTDELVRWMRSDCQPADEVIVIRDVSMSGNGEQSRYLIGLLDSMGIAYRSVSSVQDLQMGKFGSYRLLIASDDDAFITRTVKDIGIASKIHDNIILYTTSRVRNCVGPNVSDLHDANTRLTAAYFIDYGSEEVQEFVLAYRSLFGSEPGSFAFQGYDLVKYYATAFERYGRRWTSRLDDFPSEGLQSDFRFDRSEGRGRLNTAVRRVVYGRDLSTTLVK